MSLSKLEIFKSPQCLIESSKEGILRLKEHVIAEISTIKIPVVVVGIAGLYRTGKSYLMNVLAQERKGFPLGNTIQAATKGIWVWCREHPTQINTVLLLMDTEGFGDVEKGNPHHDDRIFTLTVLMSKVVCYNITGALNVDAIERIALSSKLAAKINNKYKIWNTPDLVVCLRDFVLDLEINGQVITEDEYLQNSLKSKSTEPVHNSSREQIQNLYKCIRCFSFDRPGDRNLLKNLETAREEDLSHDFLMDTNKFKEHIYTVMPADIPNVGNMSGLAFSIFIKDFLEAFQVGEIPDVPSTLQRWSAVQNEMNVACIVERHAKEVKAIELPVLSSAKFTEMCDNKVKGCIQDVREKIISENNEKYVKEASTQIGKTVTEVEKNNNEQCYLHWMGSIPSLYNKTVGSKQSYYRIGGLEDYKRKMQEFKKIWNQDRFAAEEQRKLALEQFLKMRDFDEDEIFEESKNLNELRKENAIKEKRYESEKSLRAQRRQFEERREAEERKRKEEAEKRLSDWKQSRINRLHRQEQMMNIDLQNYAAERLMDAAFHNAREHAARADILLLESRFQNANLYFTDSDSD